MSTYSAKPSEIKPKWYVIDAQNVVLGRLLSFVSCLIRGKHFAGFTPHINCGDKIIVINAGSVALSGKKADLNKGKKYYRHTGYPGGLKEVTAGKILSGNYPERVIKLGLKGMMPKNKLAATIIKRNFYVYADAEHPHTAQKPEVIDFAGLNAKNVAGRNSR